MSVRLNNAKNFKGKSYIVSEELDSLLTAMKIDGNTLTIVNNGGKIGDDALTSKTIDLSGLTKFASGKEAVIVKAGTSATLLSVTSNAFDASGLVTFLGSSVTSNKVVTTDASGNLAYGNAIVTTIAGATSACSDTNIPTEKAVRAAIDNKAIDITMGTGINVDATDRLKPILSTNVKLATVSTSGTDYAASYIMVADKYTEKAFAEIIGSKYELVNGQYKVTSDTSAVEGKKYYEKSEEQQGAQINLAKDQFLKSAEFGWATKGDGTGWQKAKDSTHTVPVIKFVVYATTSGVTKDTELYIDCTSFYREYEAGNYLKINYNTSTGNGNIISAVVGNGIDTAVTSAITVKAGNGIAVDANGVAVKIETATDALKIFTAKGTETDLIASTSSGVVVANVQSAIDLAVNDEHKVAGDAITAMNTKVNSAVGNIETALDSAITNVNSAVGTNIASVNTALTSTVASVNTQVGALKDTASATVSSVNAQASALKDSVNSAVSVTTTNVKSAVSAVVADVGSKVNTAVDNVNAQVTSLTSSVNTAVATTTSNVKTAVTSVVGDVGSKVNAVITDINTQVSAFKGTVTSTITNVQTAVTNVVDAIDSSVKAAVADVEANVTSALTKVVQVFETEFALTSMTSTVYGTTVSAANHVLAVYDGTGVQIYPEIMKSGSGFILKADFGSATVDSKWSVVYTQDHVAMAAATVTTMSYTSGTNTVAYTNASAVTMADVPAITAGTATYTSATGVTMADVPSITAGTAAYTAATNTIAYTDATVTSATKTDAQQVDIGTITPETITISALTYKNSNN